MKNLTNNSLPTQLGEPHRWEERPLSPLTLRPPPPTRTEGVKSRGCSLWRRNAQRQILGLIGLTVLCIFGYYLFSRYVATAVVVQGRSMMPTLQEGDRFILNRWSYFHRSPHRGDLVVVKDPGHTDYAVKRVVGMPCEALHFKRGTILVNGKYLLEPYLASGTQTFLPDSREKLLVVGKDQYFVLGDNRANSEDSRYYGAVHRSQIIGSISK